MHDLLQFHICRIFYIGGKIHDKLICFCIVSSPDICDLIRCRSFNLSIYDHSLSSGIFQFKLQLKQFVCISQLVLCSIDPVKTIIKETGICPSAQHTFFDIFKSFSADPGISTVIDRRKISIQPFFFKIILYRFTDFL